MHLLRNNVSAKGKKKQNHVKHIELEEEAREIWKKIRKNKYGKQKRKMG